MNAVAIGLAAAAYPVHNFLRHTGQPGLLTVIPEEAR
jgi:hypothetical protein